MTKLRTEPLQNMSFRQSEQKQKTKEMKKGLTNCSAGLLLFCSLVNQFQTNTKKVLELILNPNLNRESLPGPSIV